MNNYLITTNGEVKDLGEAKTYSHITSAKGVKPIIHSDPVILPPAQPVRGGVVVQQVAPPTPEQIAAVVISLSCPASLPHWRVRRILIKHNLHDTVLAYINAIVDPDLKSTTLCAWEGGADVARRGPTVLGAKVALGLTDRQIDDMFLEGAKLEA